MKQTWRRAEFNLNLTCAKTHVWLWSLIWQSPSPHPPKKQQHYLTRGVLHLLSASVVFFYVLIRVVDRNLHTIIQNCWCWMVAIHLLMLRRSLELESIVTSSKTWKSNAEVWLALHTHDIPKSICEQWFNWRRTFIPISTQYLVYYTW